jgi:hypothetical protein
MASPIEVHTTWTCVDAGWIDLNPNESAKSESNTSKTLARTRDAVGLNIPKMYSD